MDNRRLILLMVFSFSLLMVWEKWQQHVAPKPPATATAAASAQGGAASVPAAPTAAVGSAAVPTVKTAGTVQVPGAEATQPAGARVRVRTDRYIADIAAPGGDIVRLELLGHRAAEDKTRNLVLFDEKHRYAAQTGLVGAGLPNHKSQWQLPAGDQELKDGQDELRLSLTAAGEGGVKVTKTYVFRRGNHLIDVEYGIANGGAQPLAAHAYFQLVRDDKSPEGSSAMMSTFTGPAFYSETEKYQKLDFADIEKGKAKHVGKTDNGWVGMVQHYFVSAWLPPGKGEREFYTRKLDAGFVAAGVIVPVAAIAPGQTGTLKVPLYAGPQIQDRLSKLAPGLDLVVDYGWLHMIAAPLFWVLETIHKLVGNWGWAIILLTVLIKAAFYPLSAASYKSMAKMRVLTPKLMKLKETYADDRQRMNVEMMELYKREKVNPFGGCLPILVQIPVFIALYWVLLGTVEMRGAPWLGWIADLSEKDPYFILPLIMGVTMIIQTKLNPTPPDPIQAKVMMIMPIVFTGMFVMFPAGLVLYWTINNVLSIAQQWQINRVIEAAGLKTH